MDRGEKVREGSLPGWADDLPELGAAVYSEKEVQEIVQQVVEDQNSEKDSALFKTYKYHHLKDYNMHVGDIYSATLTFEGKQSKRLLVLKDAVPTRVFFRDVVLGQDVELTAERAYDSGLAWVMSGQEFINRLGGLDSD